MSSYDGFVQNVCYLIFQISNNLIKLLSGKPKVVFFYKSRGITPELKKSATPNFKNNCVHMNILILIL
jgi:hypothetical protein